MIKQILAFFLFLFCIVGHSCEKEPLLPDVMTSFECALAAKTSVWVMVVHEGERYTASYDVGGETVEEVWVPDGKEERMMIVPIMDVLQTQALKGYEKRRFFPQKKDFSKELECIGGAVERWRYKRCDFFSLSLRYFLTVSCPKLKKKSKVSWDHCGHRLTDDILQRFAPPDGQLLSFVIQDARYAVAEVLAAKKEDPLKVFMALPGVGVVKGCPARTSEAFKERRVNHGCFLSHKIQQDAMWWHRYPYDAERWKTCLNYS